MKVPELYSAVAVLVDSENSVLVVAMPRAATPASKKVAQELGHISLSEQYNLFARLAWFESNVKLLTLFGWMARTLELGYMPLFVMICGPH